MLTHAAQNTFSRKKCFVSLWAVYEGEIFGDHCCSHIVVSIGEGNELSINSSLEKNGKASSTTESSCQTELEILRRQMEEFEDELEQVRETMEKESAEEKEDFEMRVRND